MHYVLIGNSIASTGCIEGIRKHDVQAQITVIGDESYHCYARPLISYLLQEKTTVEKMAYRCEEFYEKHKVRILSNSKVSTIDPTKKELSLADGSKVGYDKLLIATGSSAFIPPMKHLEKVKNQFTFMTLADAEALNEALTKNSKVLIIGAGLIGLKCAEGILKKVKSIEIVDLANRILPSILDEEGSNRVQAHLEEEGITFHLQDSVAQFEEGKAFLASQKVLDFDLLVIAVGVKPNVELAKNAGIEVERGILIDHHCRTSCADVYAAGDCAQGWELTTQTRRMLPLLGNAFMQGECAGSNMAGVETRLEKSIAMNAIGFLGLHVITAGIYEGEDTIIQSKTGYKRLFVQDDYLVGYILVGDMVDRAGIYTSLIRERTPLSSLDFSLITEQPALMAFAQQVRKQQLGRAQ